MTSDEKLTPVAQQVVPALREKQRIERRSRPLTWMIAVSAAVTAAALVYLGAHAAATDEVTHRLDTQGQARDQQISGIQNQLKGVCRQVTDPAKLTPAERDGCYRAENSIPPVPVTITTQAPAGSGVTPAQVQAMIDSALAQVPRPLTVEQVAAVAQQIFATNASSLTPTPEKIRDAVASFCAEDTCRGPAGKNGADGKDAPPVTPDQIQQQVAAFCAANNGCVGPIGPRGYQGISVGGFGDPESDPNPNHSTHCRIPVTLVDQEPHPGETNPATSETYFNVPDVFCLPD